MRVLGIDPGSRRLGWGVVERRGPAVAHVASGTLAVDGGPLAPRLCELADGIDAVIAQHGPAVAAVESVFCAKNSRSALVLGHARGAALVSLARGGLTVHEYTPGQVKQAVTGRGRADKDQVQAMVKLLLALAGSMGLDTSDALAVAICHAHTAPSVAALARIAP